MKTLWRLTLTLGTAIILFSIKVMHAGRPHDRGWLSTWSRPTEGRTTGEYFNGWRP